MITNDNSNASEGAATTPPAETPPPAASTPKVFTQEEVNRIAAVAREEGRKSVAKQTPAPATAAPAVTPSAPPVEETSDKLTLRKLQEQIEETNRKLEKTEARAAYNKAAGGFGLTDQQADDYFDLYQMQKPTDALAWFATKGFKPTTATAPAAPATSAATTPAAPPSVAPQAPTGPVNPMTSGGLVDLFNLTPAQLQQLGPSGVRAEYEKIINHGRQMNGAARLPKLPVPPR